MDVLYKNTLLLINNYHLIFRASNIDEIRSALKEFEVIYEALVVDVNKARVS